MTPPLTPGQRLIADASPFAAASPLKLADTLAEAISDELGDATRVISAELNIDSPNDVHSSELVTPSATVTALLAERGNAVRTEVSARLVGTHSFSASVRFAFTASVEHDTAVSELFCPGSGGWNDALHARLREDDDFTRLIETYDGTIGIEIGGRPVHIRCYRGQVLEVVSRSVLGADFVLSIPGDVFIDLMSGERNRFMEAAMSGQMRSSGSGYEYLRMTSALMRLIDHCRAVAASAGYAGTQTSSDENLQVA